MKQDPPLQIEAQLPPPPPPRRPTAVGCEDYPFPPGLTPREIDILRLVIVGLDNQQIAQRLGTRLSNVEKYILRLQTKVDWFGQQPPLGDLLQLTDKFWV